MAERVINAAVAVKLVSARPSTKSRSRKDRKKGNEAARENVEVFLAREVMKSNREGKGKLSGRTEATRLQGCNASVPKSWPSMNASWDAQTM